MLRGFWALTWVETKIFLREPMGVVGTLGIPVVLFLVLGQTLQRVQGDADMLTTPAPFNVAILAALMIAVNAVLSLVAVISIYREGGILKRLRATPLSPITILGAHVMVKLLFTVASLALLVAVGRRMLPGMVDFPLASFACALLLGTLSILSLGFIVASIVPTARFAQPIGAAILYPMIALSGVFMPVERFPPFLQKVAYMLPTTHAVTLMQGVWDGAGWGPQIGSVVALVAGMGVYAAVATRVFRWE